MALIPIMGQPVNLVPNNERAFGCEPENPYCVLYGQVQGGGEILPEFIMVQMQQTPCAGTIISNGTFEDGTDWTADVNVVIAQNKATHTVGASGELIQDLSAVLLGDTYFQIKVTVTGLSAGNIQLYFTQAGSASYTFTENGIYTIYLYDVGDNDDINFLFSSDCDASVSDVAVFALLDETDLSTVASLTTIDGVFVEYLTGFVFEDYVLFNKATSTLDEGCYSIQIVDPCIVAAQLVTVNILDNDFENAPAEWTISTNSGTIAFVTGDILKLTTGATTPARGRAVQPNPIPTGNDLYVTVTIYPVYYSDNFNLVLYVDDGAITEILRVDNIASGSAIYRSFIIPAGVLNPSVLDFGIMLENTSGNVGEEAGISYIEMKSVNTNGTTGIYDSNCLKVSADTTGTRIVEGFAELTDESSSPIKGKSLGFLFVEDYFWLRARLGVQFSNPHTPTSTDNNLSSNGRTKKAYAQLIKAWDLTFHAVDENMHDTIANIINCDSFQIEGNEYVTDEKEYTANYGENGINAVAESTIEVQKVLGTRFNTNQ